MIEKKEKRYSKVWIQQPGSAFDKRQRTLQVCVRAEGKQPKLAIIYRGTGKRIKETEQWIIIQMLILFPEKCVGRYHCICRIGQ